MQSESILLALGQDKEAAKYCQEYMWAFLPGLVLLGYADMHRRFLNSIGRNTIPLIALVVGTCMHYFLSKYLVIDLELGITGTGLAGIALWSTILIVQLAYANYYVPEIDQVLEWPDQEVFDVDGLTEYVRLAIPQILLTGSDWWAAELMIIVAGILGKKELTTMIVIVNIGGMMTRVALGLDQAACTLIG